MKKVFAILVFAFCNSLCFSQWEVDIKTAEKVAENFFCHTFKNGILIKDEIKEVQTKDLKIKNSYAKTYKNHNSYYVVNFESGGWAFVSAHKNVGPVFMYSESGNIDEKEEQPDVFTEWVSQYDQVIDLAFEKNEVSKEKAEKWKNCENNTFEETGNRLKSYNVPNGFFLMNTAWGQSKANNDVLDTVSYMPAYNVMMGGSCSNQTGKYLAGCTPVSIGQILKYWEYASGFDVDFEWWNMPDNLYSNDIDFDKKRYAISGMLYNIGHRLHSEYGCFATSTSLSRVEETFGNLGYNRNTISKKRKALHTYNSWVNLLKDELDEGRPIQYNSKTHSFVCDGYKYGTHEFHFNLGWNSRDTWCDFESLKLEGVTTFHTCFIGIEPDFLESFSLQTNYEITDTNSITIQAENIIIAGDNHTFTVQPNGLCRLLTDGTVTLQPGFWAKPGSEFLAKYFTNENWNKSFLIDIKDDFTIDSIFNINSEFKIYPNPSSNGLFFIAKPWELKDKKMYIKISNLKGQTLLSQSFNTQTISVSLKDKPQGVYTLTILLDEKTFTYKLLNH